VALTTAALLMVILTVVFNTVVRHHLRRQEDEELRTRAAAVATTVDTSGPRVRALETANDRLLDANSWIYVGSRPLERPPSAGPLTRVADDLARHTGRRCVTVDGHGSGPVRLCAEPVPGARQAVTVVTALDLSPYRSSADTLLLGSLVLDAVMLACTYALTRLAVGRALRPVGTMTDQATQWSAVASGERFGSADRPAELARLGASLDALLDRIRAVLRHERQLTGELSHELRTPLSRIVAELDWYGSRPRTAAETRAVHRTIAEAAESMRTICDTLLNTAREDTATAPGTAPVLPTLRGLADQQIILAQVTVTVDAADPRLEAGVQPALLERIVSPLLANALRYAVSTVTVHADRDDTGLRVTVTDDGPGVPPAFIPHLFQPGRRADPADGHTGAGLGLPLARRLARSAGGEVTYDPDHSQDHGYGHSHDHGHDRHPAPGARFVVRLPSG